MTWENAWQEGRTGWDAGQSPPALQGLIAAGGFAGEGRAMVTGCGAGYDVFSLAKAGYQAIGLDLAPTAAKRFAEVREEQGLQPAQADIVLTDFFTYSPDEPFDVIWDYTFLCAIEPERRPDWAAQMAKLLAPEGVLWTLLFPVDIDDPSATTADDPGPPYRLHPEVAKALLEPAFQLASLDEVKQSHPGREGKEWLASWRKAG